VSEAGLPVVILVEAALEEEAKHTEATEDTTFVETFQQGTAALEQDAGIPTILPTQMSRSHRTLSESEGKKTRNSRKPEQITMPGRDSSSLRRHEMMSGQSKDSGTALLQF
jgi:hypothetical protein